MPSEQANLPKPIKSRSVVSLASLNGGSLQNSKAKSTPASPIVPRKTMSRSSSRSNSSSTGTVGPAHHPAGLTMTAANRQQYIQTMQRDYSMRLGGHREGGYAIAATMNAPPSIHGLGGSVGDFGSMRYSGDWSGSGVSQGSAFEGDRTALTDFGGPCSSMATAWPTLPGLRCPTDFIPTRRRPPRSRCPRRSSTCIRQGARRLRRRPRARLIRPARTPRVCPRACHPAQTSCKRRPAR